MKVKITTTNQTTINSAVKTALASYGKLDTTITTTISDNLKGCFYPFTDIELNYIGDYETELECTGYVTKFIYRKLSPIMNYLKHIQGGAKTVLENGESSKTFERDQTVQKDITKNLNFTKDNTLVVSEVSSNQSMSEQSPISDVIGEIDTPNFKSNISHIKDNTDTIDETETETGTIGDDTILTDDYTDITTNFDTEYQIKARRYLLSDDVNKIFDNIVKSTIQEYNKIF